MVKEFFYLALTNLKHRGVRSWLTMIGIFIGIAAVVSLISLGQGLQEGITGQFATLDADKLFIQNSGTGLGPPGSTVVRKLTERDLKLIENVNGVEEAVPRLIRVVSFEFNDFRRFNDISDVPDESEQIEIVKNSLDVEILEGKFLEPEDRGKVVLGNSFVDIDFGKEIRIGSKVTLQGEVFEVIGILEESGNFFINSGVFVAREDLESIVDINDEIDLILVQVEDEDKVEEVAENIEKALRRDRNLREGEEDFSVQTPLQSLGAITTILDIINLIVIGIAAISLLVGGIGIANTMYTSVLERTKEIGVMKSIGAKNSDILLIFVIESGLLGLLGGIVGATIGIGLAFGVSFVAQQALNGLNFPIRFSLPLTSVAIGFSLLIGILAGIIPAFQASKLNPVDALRK